MIRLPKHFACPARFGRAAAAGVVVLALGATDARASVSARANPPGPALTTSARTLAAALSCPRGVGGGRRSVLLVPGSLGNPAFVFSAGFERLLRANRFAVCAVSLPDAAFGDIQIEAEYVVASIRKMAARSGRQVSVVGVSQGGMLPRWALKWWPDVRSLVGDVIGLAPGNHGSPVLAAACNAPCPPATRQQIPGSRFLAALNRGDETPGRLPYSVISSATDFNIPPPSPNLRGESDDSNTQVQAICPGRNVDHGHITYDAVAIALVLDALRHAGPARGSRVPNTTCARKYARHIDQAEVDRQMAAANAYLGANYGRAGLTTAEPALKRYATRPAPRPRATLRIRPRRVPTGRRTTISFRATGRSGRQRWPLRRARVKVAGRTVITNARGRASLRLRLRRQGLLRVRLVAPGLSPVTARVRAQT
jgi:triacylglycerol lipase